MADCLVPPTNPSGRAAALVPKESELLDALETFRPYLLALAQRELDEDLKKKAGASDLVQETIMAGYKEFPLEKLDCPGVMQRWLIRVLERRMGALRHRYRMTQKRQIGREVPLESGVELRVQSIPDKADRTPSSIAGFNEQRRRLADAIGRLTPEHRDVLTRRVYEGEPFAVIAHAMCRSEEAVQMLYLRALRAVRREFEALR